VQAPCIPLGLKRTPATRRGATKAYCPPAIAQTHSLSRSVEAPHKPVTRHRITGGFLMSKPRA